MIQECKEDLIRILDRLWGGIFLLEGLDIKFGDFKSCVLYEAYNIDYRTQ